MEKSSKPSSLLKKLRDPREPNDPVIRFANIETKEAKENSFATHYHQFTDFQN